MLSFWECRNHKGMLGGKQLREWRENRAELGQWASPKATSPWEYFICLYVRSRTAQRKSRMMMMMTVMTVKMMVSSNDNSGDDGDDGDSGDDDS